MLKRLLLLGLLLALPVLVLAQDETETDEPVIAYFQADTGFNVPVLGDNWERETASDSILYVDATTQGNMFVNTVRTLDDSEAIATTIEAIVSEPVGEPVFDERIGLLNGTWTQRHYVVGDTSISAFALVRSDRTFVVTFWENSSDYDMRFVIVRVPTQTDDNGDTISPEIQTGIDLALEATGNEFSTEPDAVEFLDIDGDAWLRVTYPTDATPFNALGYQFRDFTYTALVRGELTDPMLQNADDLERLILGFFITPDNINFLYLGLGASAAIFLALIVSMWLRYRNAQEELKLVEQIAADN